MSDPVVLTSWLVLAILGTPGTYETLSHDTSNALCTMNQAEMQRNYTTTCVWEEGDSYTDPPWELVLNRNTQ